MKKTLLLFLFLISATDASSNEIYKGHLQVKTLSVHYGVYQPTAPAIANVLFLHGYGDSFVNHESLFQELNNGGLRVIGFDYPSHGDTDGKIWDDLNHQSFTSLTHLAAEVFRSSRDNTERPLFIAGWSTGGLHAVRIAQVLQFRAQFPNLAGLILLAPGVSVKKCVGSSNDRYVKTNSVKRWVVDQRRFSQAQIKAYQCPNAFHKLDNEPAEFGGDFVRKTASRFAQQVFGYSSSAEAPLASPCEEF